MLMAAGLGTRLRPFTEREPKALLPLLGVPMAQFALDALAAAGAEKVVANIHHHAVRAREGLLALERPGMELEISDESDELLGSGGGIRKALPSLGGGPFYLVNADTLCDADLGALASEHQRLRRRWGVRLTLTVFPAGPAGGKYREILFDPTEGRVTGFGQPVAGRPYFAGAAIVEPDAFVDVPASGPADFLQTILEPAIRAGKAGIFLSQGSWLDVGSPGLWLSAHLGLIADLELGRISPRWRSRIETGNVRVGPQAWVSRTAAFGSGGKEWAGPAYWNPYGDPEAVAPRCLGPRAVLYGRQLEAGAPLRSGIGFGGQWVSG